MRSRAHHISVKTSLNSNNEMAFNYWKKMEDDGDGGLFLNLNKSTVLQEARVFNASPVKPRQCRVLLSKICCILYQGEVFTKQEATDLFFGVTKLFQCQEPSLRQMVYLVIKELSTISDDVIMVTSSLMKDMQPKSELSYRANAIRALCCITEPSMLQAVERFLKAAIVDKAHQVSSAALVGAYHFYNAANSPAARELIKRWANEVQEAAQAKAPSGLSSFIGGGSQINQNSSYIVQYHALGLLYGIRSADKMAIIKLVQGLTKGSGGMSGGGGSLKSPLSICLLIRFACKVLLDEDRNGHRELFDLLEGFLRHRSDMVSYEAARAICSCPQSSLRDLTPAINALQLLLSSQRSTMRFAAVRTLNELAQRQPTAVQSCNLDLETLVTDSNRSIATLAITTLLKTGNEASVDRLTKQISGFMNDISDEFKVIVVNAIRSLCLKFPSKQAILLEFLSGVLRDEGGQVFKKEVVEAMFDVCKYIPEAKPTALSHLCEFIEDCEFSKLAARVLYFLGEEGPNMPNPTVYIRHIYNRVVLENAVVRAAAVSALAKFGVNCVQEEVKESIRVLLQRCLEDRDDEVRDRAAMYLAMMNKEATEVLKMDTAYALATLESQLVEYCNRSDQTEPFSTDHVPRITKEEQAADALRAKSAELVAEVVVTKQEDSSSTSAGLNKQSTKPTAEFYAEALAKVQEFASYGALFKSSAEVALTEAETEYSVHCIKHTFRNYVVFQFNLLNTIQDQWLEDVRVEMTPLDEGALELQVSIPCPQLPFDKPGVAYVSFLKEEGGFPTGSFSCMLRFIVKDCDPSTGEPDDEGYEDEYQLEDVELGVGDYIQPFPLFGNNAFEAFWQKLTAEQIEVFELGAFDTLQAAVTGVLSLVNLAPAAGSQVVQAGAVVHVLQAAGLFLGGVKVGLRAKYTLAEEKGVVMELAVRGEDEQVTGALLTAIA